MANSQPDFNTDTQPNKQSQSVDPSRIHLNPGETWQQAQQRYQNDYWQTDRDSVLNVFSQNPNGPPTQTQPPDYSNPQAQLSQVQQWLQASPGYQNDDPNYWVGRINDTGGFTPQNLSYWQARIAAGSAGGAPGGAYYDPAVANASSSIGSSTGGLVAGQNPLDPNAANNLFNTLLQRSGQSLNVNPNDPIIKGQTNAYNQTQNEQAKKYLSQAAEQAGPYGNLGAETRSVNESVGKNTAGFQASLMQNELTQRRNEIQNALSEEGSLLSDNQRLALQQQVSAIDAALQQQQINSSNDQFAAQFGLNAAQMAWLQNAYSTGLLG